MGSSSSKLRKHLQSGDELAALQLYSNSSELQKALDPNCSYGDTHAHDTPLHLGCRHAMKSLLRIFLSELGGNPNKRNSRSETSLHAVCSGGGVGGMMTFTQQQRRADCLALLLGWKGAVLANGDMEKANLTAQDEKLNSPLHYAASSGIKRCVEMIVGQGAPLFLENSDKQTPCDSAEKCGHSDIALYLESKMVFSNVDDNLAELESQKDQIESLENYSGLRAQDLQEAKDQLLVETSDMLHVPLFTAEALLRNHEWSRETLLEAWMTDAIACCDKCGVVPPGALYDDLTAARTADCAMAAGKDAASQEEPICCEAGESQPTEADSSETMCEICANAISVSEHAVSMTCDHQFCRACWERYLTGKIEEGEAHNITCPGFGCSKLVPVEVIETVVSRDVARRYLQFDIKAFVESNPCIKWCPFPGCGRAVRLPDADNPLSPSFHGLGDPSETSHAVDCGVGHLFCWECLGEAHEPSSCEHWKCWHQKIAEIRPDELKGTEDETESAANCLWLVTNSKACPNCRSPIQKNEGCNHMKCSKCKHDFCWVCLELWKRHSSATGGYFRCNRYEVVKKVEESQGHAKTDAELKNKKLQELNRFVHYYTRYKNHENSGKLELPLLSTAKGKMMVLARAVTDPETANDETKFVEDAVHQLLKARRVLKCSYVYGYYLADTGYKKPIFEFMQTELEECTEMLSEMVARPYLRTPRTKIIQTAILVQRKRYEFVTAIAKGLIPPDTSPSLRNQRRQFTVELDEDMRKALLASMQDMDASTSSGGAWVKAPSGKHTNVSALLDWPEEDDESDSDNMQAGAGVAAAAAATAAMEMEETGDREDEEGGDDVTVEPCSRMDCQRPRARNRRTGDMHNHCSMRCMVLDRSNEQARNDDKATSKAGSESITDYQMDLLRALEMSRLQFLREMGSLNPASNDRNLHRSDSGETSEDLQSRPMVDPFDDPRPGTSSEAVQDPELSMDAEMDAEMKTALDMKQTEEDLKLAMMLSLDESTTPSAALRPMGRPRSCSHAESPSVSDPQYCSAVTRIPNHSVEELTDGSSVLHTPSPGGHRRHRSHGDEASAKPVVLMGAVETMATTTTKPFGLMKDVSITNIVSSDVDKTSAFADKDFRVLVVVDRAEPLVVASEPIPHQEDEEEEEEQERIIDDEPPVDVSDDNPWHTFASLSPDELSLLPNNQRPAPNHGNTQTSITTSHNEIHQRHGHKQNAHNQRQAQVSGDAIEMHPLASGSHLGDEQVAVMSDNTVAPNNGAPLDYTEFDELHVDWRMLQSLLHSRRDSDSDTEPCATTDVHLQLTTDDNGDGDNDEGAVFV